MGACKNIRGLADLSGHGAIARDQRCNDGLAEWAVGEHRFDEERARHSRDRRLLDREDAGRARRAFEGAQFAEERASFNVGENEVLSGSVERGLSRPVVKK